MELSSPRFKSLAVTAGLSFWFFIITNLTGYFSLLTIVLFVIILGSITQVFAKKLSKVLNVFAIYNTKIFLGITFVLVISIYGILFKILKIDLLRLKNKSDSYWLEIETSNNPRKQY